MLDKPVEWIELFYEEAMKMEEARQPTAYTSSRAPSAPVKGVHLNRPPTVKEFKRMGITVGRSKK